MQRECHTLLMQKIPVLVEVLPSTRKVEEILVSSHRVSIWILRCVFGVVAS